MSVIISICNIKGGVGKTTCTINLAGAMASLGRNVLVIDNDPQGNVSHILNVTNQYTLYDLYDNHKVNLSDCITKYSARIDVVTNDIQSAILEKILHQQIHGETVLKKKMVSKYTDMYDYILIDNSPFLGMLTTNALAVSDYYIEIIDNSTSALQGLNMVQMLVNDIIDNAYNRDLKLLGILRSRFEKRTIFSRDFSSVVEEVFEDKLFKTVIPDSVRYKEACAKHLTIQEHNKKYAKPFKDLYYEILNLID